MEEEPKSNIIGVEWNQNTDDWRRIDINGNTLSYTPDFTRISPFRDIRRVLVDNTGTITAWGSDAKGTGLTLDGSAGRVMTCIPHCYLKSANPMNPRLHCFDINCIDLNIKHYLIDKGKPCQNGKVERFHGTCEREFYQRQALTTLNQARKKFRDFLYYYNHEREHQGLDGLTPLEKLRTFNNYSYIKSLD